MANVGIATKTITRPTGTTQYTANDALSDSTTAPTTGGFLFAEFAGVSGTITDIVVVSSNDPATLLQGELWLFDDSVTNINDNAAFALSDANAIKAIGPGIPFTLASTTGGSGTNSIAHVIDYQAGFDCTNKAGLYALIKVINAYTPADSETLTFRIKFKRA